MLFLDTSKEECIRRALGRKVDPEGGVVYHIDDNKPPTDQAPLCERLTDVEELERNASALVDRHLAFDVAGRGMAKWFRQFGVAEEDTRLLRLVDGSREEVAVFGECAEQLRSVLEFKRRRLQQVKEGFREEILEARRKAEEEEKKRLEEEERARLAAEKAGEEGEEGEEAKPEEVEKEEEGEKEEEVKAEEPIARDNLDGDFRPIMLKEWSEIETDYTSDAKAALTSVREQRDRIVKGFAKIQREFIEFLQRPDEKQKRLDAFVEEFNRFSDEFPDLREDEQTKEELHQRVDQLADDLYDVAEERKEEALEERSRIMGSGWIEAELEMLTTIAQDLLQNEVDKFRGCVQLLQDYYCAVEDRVIPEPPTQTTTELIGEGEELPPVQGEGEGGSFPRLEKLYEKAIRA